MSQKENTMASHESEEDRRVSKKFYEKVQDKPLKEPFYVRMLNFMEDRPMLTAGGLVATLLGIRGYRKGKNLPSFYPKSVYVLDVRVQVCGAIVVGVMGTAIYDLYLMKQEKQEKDRLRESGVLPRKKRRTLSTLDDEKDT